MAGAAIAQPTSDAETAASTDWMQGFPPPEERIIRFTDDDYFAGDKLKWAVCSGVHGQTIWIDPAAEMVIVRLASHPVAANAANDPTSLPAYRALADYLMER